MQFTAVNNQMHMGYYTSQHISSSTETVETIDPCLISGQNGTYASIAPVPDAASFSGTSRSSAPALAPEVTGHVGTAIYNLLMELLGDAVCSTTTMSGRASLAPFNGQLPSTAPPTSGGHDDCHQTSNAASDTAIANPNPNTPYQKLSPLKMDFLTQTCPCSR
jgi:hypothetical protein